MHSFRLDFNQNSWSLVVIINCKSPIDWNLTFWFFLCFRYVMVLVGLSLWAFSWIFTHVKTAAIHYQSYNPVFLQRYVCLKKIMSQLWTHYIKFVLLLNMKIWIITSLSLYYRMIIDIELFFIAFSLYAPSPM